MKCLIRALQVTKLNVKVADVRWWYDVLTSHNKVELIYTYYVAFVQ